MLHGNDVPLVEDKQTGTEARSLSGGASSELMGRPPFNKTTTEK